MWVDQDPVYIEFDMDDRDPITQSLAIYEYKEEVSPYFLNDEIRLLQVSIISEQFPSVFIRF